MAMDLTAPGAKVLAGAGGGTSPSDPFTQAITSAQETPVGYQQIADLGSAVGLTPAVGALWAVIVAENADTRWRDDGAAPTASIGMPLPALSTFVYRGDLTAIQFVAQSGAPILNVSYYK